jgi:hypothetical protein
MPASQTDNEWFFLPPPECTWRKTQTGVQLSMQKGNEPRVWSYLRGWLAVIEDAVQRSVPQGFGEASWPTWEGHSTGLQPGVTDWDLSLPAWASATIFSGGERGAVSGEMRVQFPRGREPVLIRGLVLWLAQFQPRQAPQIQVAPGAPGSKRLTPGEIALAASLAGARTQARPQPQPPAADPPQSQAREAGDKFFASGPVTMAGRAAEAVNTMRGIVGDLHDEVLNSEPPPIPQASGDNTDVPAEIAPPQPQKKKLVIPQCTCPDAVKAMGGHQDGCPAENIPHGFSP